MSRRKLTSRHITPPLELLQEEHEALDARLKSLGRHLSLSPQEQYEALVIKKRKLALKDRINAQLARRGSEPRALNGAAQAASATPAAPAVAPEQARARDESARVLDEADAQGVRHPAQWSAGERAELVLSLLRGEAPLPELAQAHGLDVSVLLAWQARFMDGAIRALDDSPSTQDAALAQLQARLRMMVNDLDVMRRVAGRDPSL